MSKRPVTKDHQDPGDMSLLFRTQEARSLAEIDTLIQRQIHLKNKLGEEKAKEIEKDPDQYYNHDKFRIW